MADPQRGRFRSFLLTVFKNFLANEWDKGRAQKRGGGHSPVSLDFTVGESRYVREPEDDLTPDQEGYWLEVVNTEVTYRGVSGLKRTLPSVEITVDRSSIFGDEETD